VEEQVAQGGYGSASEFVTSLLEAERAKNVGAEIEALLLEAVDGPFEDWTDTDMDDIRRVGRALIERRKSGK
jgi:Arc/MetJ-type ribon-helix-helix transcriptional regulator